MAFIQVFCTNEELSQWLQLLYETHRFASLTFRWSMKPRIGELALSNSDLNIREDVVRIFLFPQAHSPTKPLTMNEVQARRWGWLDVRPGHLVNQFDKRILLLSQIHGEDFDIEPVHPAKYVHWLRRRIKGETYLGVKIKSEDTPGDRLVRDIRYSKQALTLHRSGVVWKQFVDARTFFVPVDHATNSEERDSAIRH